MQLRTQSVSKQGSHASKVAISEDGVEIRYGLRGDGELALIFVHGWCCNRFYWDEQVRFFSKRFRVVTLDLAGHGMSGQARRRWSMKAFGQDVVAVVQSLRLDRMLLIGHSMGGAVIVEAASQLAPSPVLGLIGVDTWQRIEHPRTKQEVLDSVAPYKSDFSNAVRDSVRAWFHPTADASLVEKVAIAMSVAPPRIAIPALTEFRNHDSKVRAGLNSLSVPKITINSSHLPTSTGVRPYGVEVKRVSGVGHFPMLEKPEAFNSLLDTAIAACREKSKRKPEELRFAKIKASPKRFAGERHRNQCKRPRNKSH